MLSVVLSLILTRIYVRIKLLKKALILSDYLLFAAYIFAILHCVCDILMYKYDVLDNRFPHSMPILPLDPVRIIEVFKVCSPTFLSQAQSEINSVLLLDLLHYIVPLLLRFVVHQVLYIGLYPYDIPSP
jgi:hypothetical protein